MATNRPAMDRVARLPGGASPASRRITQACVECRLAKVRCKPGTSSNTCARCTSLHFDCIYVHHPRGRKPKSRLQGRDASSIGPAAHARRRQVEQSSSQRSSEGPSSTQPQQTPAPMESSGKDDFAPSSSLDCDGARRRMLQALHRQKRRRAAPFTFVNLGSMDNLYQRRKSGDGGTQTPQRAVDSSLLAAAVQPMTLKRILQPLYADDQDVGDDENDDEEEEGEEEEAMTRDFRFDDAVSQGLLPLSTARRLFHFFITHLNMWSMIMDPDLHTHDYVRRTSPFLYSVILHLAARFSMYDGGDDAQGVTQTQCRHLQVIAKNHAATVFIDGDRSVEAVQAFFLLATWKEHDDALTYVQSGFAFRLAMDMELGKGVPKPLQKLARSLHVEQAQDQQPRDSSSAARRQHVRRLIELLRNRERCCLQLFVQDRSQAFHYIRHFTFSIQEPVIGGASEWYQQPGAKPWDAFLCASVECRKVQSKYQGIMTSLVADRDAAAAAIEGDLDAWHATWTRKLAQLTDTPASLPLHAPQRSFMEASMILWRDSIKLHLVSDLLEQDLRAGSPFLRGQTTMEAPSTTNAQQRPAGGGSPVNLISLAAFHLCVRAARSVLAALCSLPPAVLRHAPDSIHLLADHSGLFLCGMVCIRAEPPLSAEYLETTLAAVEGMRDALWRARIRESDSVALHARYLDSLAEVLRPTRAPAKSQYPPPTMTGRVRRSDPVQQNLSTNDSQDDVLLRYNYDDDYNTAYNADDSLMTSSLGALADLAAMAPVSSSVDNSSSNWFESLLTEPVSSDGEENMDDILGIINSHFGQVA